MKVCSVGHSVLLAHARAVAAYRKDFKPTQNGVIGITLNGDMALPWNDEQKSTF
jgi:beta-glucosidase